MVVCALMIPRHCVQVQSILMCEISNPVLRPSLSRKRSYRLWYIFMRFNPGEAQTKKDSSSSSYPHPENALQQTPKRQTNGAAPLGAPSWYPILRARHTLIRSSKNSREQDREKSRAHMSASFAPFHISTLLRVRRSATSRATLPPKFMDRTARTIRSPSRESVVVVRLVRKTTHRSSFITVRIPAQSSSSSTFLITLTSA